MPHLQDGSWKLTSKMFWYRKYADGRVETEYDLLTGAPLLWGPKAPDGLVEVGWQPMTSELAEKIARYGEFGETGYNLPTIVRIKPGEEVVVYKEGSTYNGAVVRCKACGIAFRAKEAPTICPSCGVVPHWRCSTCRELSERPVCKCGCTSTAKVDPLEVMAPDSWEETVYCLGIKGKFVMQISAEGTVSDT